VVIAQRQPPRIFGEQLLDGRQAVLRVRPLIAPFLDSTGKGITRWAIHADWLDQNGFALKFEKPNELAGVVNQFKIRVGFADRRGPGKLQRVSGCESHARQASNDQKEQENT
jgi:hypothetical protein